MQPKHSGIISGYLRNDAESVRTVDDWIARAAGPFRRQLSVQWEDTLREIREEVTVLLQSESPGAGDRIMSRVWRIANRACLDRIRARDRGKWADLEGIIPKWDDAEAGEFEVRLQFENGEESLRLAEEAPAECRELWHWILAGESCADISQRLGITETALRAKVLHCRKMLVEMRGQSEEAEGSEPDES